MLLLALGLVRPAAAQTFPFTSGPIPPCDTSTFTATVGGVGYLIYPDGWSWGSYLESVLINITSDHPQTLQVSLTSPEGTTLLLSAFNGAGGQNYTNTNFSLWAVNNITTGAAPFTGTFLPQGGSLDVFVGEYGDGTWTITVIDTACANGGTGPGGTWTPGWFDGGAGSGAFSFGFSSPPPPCMIDMGWQTAYICPGETADIQTYFQNNWGGWGMGLTFTFWNSWTGAIVPDPTAVSQPGQYQVEGSDWSGCFYYGTYDVQAMPAIALGPDQVVDHCIDAAPVDLAALFPMTGVIPAWSLDGVPITAATANAATAPGVYQLIGQNLGNCNDTALVTLNIVPGPVLGPDQGVNMCAGATVDLTALYSTGTDVTAWTESGVPVADPTAVVSPGIYTLTVTNAAGCSTTAEVIVTMQAAPALGPDQSHDVCSNASLDLTSLYNTTGLLAVWQFAGAPVADPSAVIAAGTYELFALGVSSCTDTAYVTVNALASPVLGPDASISVCDGVGVDLTSFFATGALTTSWTNVGTGATVPDPTTINVSGQYELIAINAADCSDTAYVQVTIVPNPVTGAGQTHTLCGGTMDLTTLYAIGANTAEWTLNGVVVADPTAVNTSGLYTITLTNASGCTASAQVLLTIDPAPALGTDQLASVCEGSTFDLTSLYSTTGLSVEWTLDGAIVADPTVAAVTGDYQLVATNGFACTDTALVIFTVNPGPSLGSDLSFALCPWQTVDLSTVFPVGGMNALYTLNGLPVDDPTAVSDTGTYVINVTDMNGCTDEAMASVSAVECLCEADFIHDARCMQVPVQFTLLADSAVWSAHWDLDGAVNSSTEIDPLVKFDSEGEVLVTLRATLSCGVVEVQRTIRLQDCSDSCSVWIPSAFTPDNDGRNDSWTWNGECEPEDFSMEIFNRWGELVFASNDPLRSWDGTYGGALSPDGVYVYRAGYRLPYQKRKEVKGFITLVR